MRITLLAFVIVAGVVLAACDSRDPTDHGKFVLAVQEFGTSTQLVFKADRERTPVQVDYIVARSPTNSFRFLFVDAPNPNGEIRRYFTTGKVFRATIPSSVLKVYSNPVPYISFRDVQFEPQK